MPWEMEEGHEQPPDNGILSLAELGSSIFMNASSNGGRGGILAAIFFCVFIFFFFLEVMGHKKKKRATVTVDAT